MRNSCVRLDALPAWKISWNADKLAGGRWKMANGKVERNSWYRANTNQKRKLSNLAAIKSWLFCSVVLCTSLNVNECELSSSSVHAVNHWYCRGVEKVTADWRSGIKFWENRWCDFSIRVHEVMINGRLHRKANFQSVLRHRRISFLSYYTLQCAPYLSIILILFWSEW